MMISNNYTSHVFQVRRPVIKLIREEPGDLLERINNRFWAYEEFITNRSGLYKNSSFLETYTGVGFPVNLFLPFAYPISLSLSYRDFELNRHRGEKFISENKIPKYANHFPHLLLESTEAAKRFGFLLDKFDRRAIYPKFPIHQRNICTWHTILEEFWYYIRWNSSEREPFPSFLKEEAPALYSFMYGLWVILASKPFDFDMRNQMVGHEFSNFSDQTLHENSTKNILPIIGLFSNANTYIDDLRPFLIWLFERVKKREHNMYLRYLIAIGQSVFPGFTYSEFVKNIKPGLVKSPFEMFEKNDCSKTVVQISDNNFRTECLSLFDSFYESTQQGFDMYNLLPQIFLGQNLEFGLDMYTAFKHLMSTDFPIKRLELSYKMKFPTDFKIDNFDLIEQYNPYITFINQATLDDLANVIALFDRIQISIYPETEQKIVSPYFDFNDLPDFNKLNVDLQTGIPLNSDCFELRADFFGTIERNSKLWKYGLQPNVSEYERLTHLAHGYPEKIKRVEKNILLREFELDQLYSDKLVLQDVLRKKADLIGRIFEERIRGRKNVFTTSNIFIYKQKNHE